MNDLDKNWDAFSSDVKFYIANNMRRPDYNYLKAELFTAFAYNNPKRPRKMMRNYVKIAYLAMLLWSYYKHEDNDET